MQDLELIFLIHDVAMARSIVTTIKMAERKNLSPELLAQTGRRLLVIGAWSRTAAPTSFASCADIIRQMPMWQCVVF